MNWPRVNQLDARGDTTIQCVISARMDGYLDLPSTSCLYRISEKIFDFDDLFLIIEEMPKRSYLGDFELMVLLALMRLGDDAYGVPIGREIEQQCGREVAIGSVYATLERLESRELVSSYLGKPTAERGGKAKRYFRITPGGMRKVRETRQALMKLWRDLPELEEVPL